MSGKRTFLCSFVLVCILVSKSQSSFFIARQYKNYNHYYCVTNTSFALSWIVDEERSQQNSLYVPESKSTFSCDITNNWCTQQYFSKPPWSLRSEVSQPILDERWEEMEVIKTEFVSRKFAPLKLVLALKIQTPNFNIPLSIRMEREGHIFLCDGDKVSESNCYWFMLQAFSGIASALRKCSKGEVPYQDQVYPEKPCSTRRVSIDHPASPSYLSTSKWSHFILSKQDELLTFSLYSDHKTLKILEWRDPETPIAVTDMIIHSKMVNGLWKIHNVDFLYTLQESNDVALGAPVYAPEGFVCISMYVQMCRSCQMKLSLSKQNGIISEMTYTPEHPGWNRIKFITDNVSNEMAMQLLVSTIGASEHRYWLLDKIRFCQKEEFRKIGLTAKATCQLMSDTENIITFDEQPAISESDCPEDTIGPFCTKCNLIFGDCTRITVCTTDQCVCSAGHYGKDCYYECDGEKYGHGCRKPCGKCYYSCGKIDGTCSSSYCNDNYSGPKCNIPPSIIFAEPPTVSNVTYDGATISVSDFKIENKESGQQPQYYLVQYKKAEDTGATWSLYNETFTFNVPTKFRMSNLNSQTRYFVRSVIVATTGQRQVGEHLKHAEFTTTCEELADNNIDIKAFDTSVLIRLVQTTDITCKSYTMSLFEVQRRSFTNSSGIYFDGLEPFTEYTLKIQSTPQTFAEKKFMTTEAAPDVIKGIVISALTSSSVDLKWTKPKLHGIFKQYTIEYQHVSYTACQARSSQPSMKTSKIVTDTGTNLTDLRPYSTYEISISASNTKFDGQSYLQQITIPASDTVDPNEIPKIFNITTDHVAANIELTAVNCESIRGPLTVKFTTKCTSEWCLVQHREPKTESRSLPTNLITLTNLIAFSNFDIELKFCRENGPCDFSEKKTFKTKPTVPGRVNDLLIYTKNETSISLRWQPPAPPRGILKEYRINYRYYKRIVHNRQMEVQPVSCELWPEFVCLTLADLYPDTYYTLEVSARNEDPPDFGPLRSVGTTTKTEQSTAPYDLKINWTLENDLLLGWRHPNETNGDVQYFGIVISINERTPIRKTFNITDNMYNLTYSYQLNATEFTPTTRYQITIFAFNGKRGLEISEETTSPPEIPTLANDPQFESSNETIQVALSLNKSQGLTDVYRLIVLRSNYDTEDVVSSQELNNYDLKNLRIVFDCNLTQTSTNSQKLILGDDQQRSFCRPIENPPLTPATSYNITVILINTKDSYRRDKIYSYSYRTIGELVPTGGSSLLALLALLLIIPIAAFIYVKRKEINSFKESFFKQNINNSSTEVLEIQDDQIPLSQVPDAGNNIQVAKKPKVQPKTSIGAKIHSKPIKITEFEEYVKESIKNGELERQHSLFPRGQTKPWTYGSLKENKSKNRYNNLIAYDHSRVVLEKIAGHPHSDYINANYIDGYKTRKAYIATQGPKVATLDDFWRMMWQENIRHIANVANIYEGGKKKVEKYWPDINETLKFGDVTVQHLSRNVFADYEHRIFTVTHNEESRKIEQLHFTSWPDHGVPLYSQSLVPFLQKILQIPLSGKSPILVHCSAGVGRTGTILLCDICLRMAAREGVIDVLRHLQILRDQRPNMVDNIEQYKLAHLVVLECLVGLHTSIPCNALEESVQRILDNGSLVLQMRYLKDTQWQDQAMKTVAHTGEEALIVREKNRFENIIPEIQGRVFITRDPPSDETSSYINAVKVDGFRCPGRFIVTQQPLPNTVGDFWRLVNEHTTSQYSVVVSLNQINPKDKSCCNFWPTAASTELRPVPHITLKHVNTMPLECYDVVTVHLYAESRKEFLPVQIIAMKKWAPKANCPEKIEGFLSFWEQADSSARGTETTFITCYDGVKASGLYVAMSFIIEKMKMEQVCDVCQAVRNVRHNRPQFVLELEQFEFLYKAAVAYINGFGSYANFN